MRREARSPARSGLRETYELLRSRRRGAGRHVYALLVTRGMAEWIRTAAAWLPAEKGPRPDGPVGPGRTRGDELPPGVVPELVPILAGLFLGPMKGGA